MEIRWFNWFFPVILLIKKSCNLDKRQNWTHPTKVVVSGANSPWSLGPCKKTRISINFFPKKLMINNSAIWLNRRHTWPQPTKKDSLRCYLTQMTSLIQARKLRHHLTLSRDNDDQRILRSDWARDTTIHTQSKIRFSDAAFPWWLTPCKKI